MPAYLTAKQLAGRLGVSPVTIAKLAKSGEIPTLQVGARFIFEEAAVVEALKVSINGAPPETKKTTVSVSEDQPKLGNPKKESPPIFIAKKPEPIVEKKPPLFEITEMMETAVLLTCGFEIHSIEYAKHHHWFIFVFLDTPELRECLSDHAHGKLQINSRLFVSHFLKIKKTISRYKT